MPHRIQRLFRLGFSRSGHEEGSDRRIQGIARAAGAGVVAKGVAMATQLALVPILLAHLGGEGFGLWGAIGGLFLFLNLADLGLGFGLQNAVSAADGRGERDRIPALVVSTMACLAVIAAIVAAGGIAVLLATDAADALGVTGGSLARDARLATWIALAAFCAGLPFTVAQRVAQGLQLGWANGAAQAVGSLVLLFGTGLGVALGAGVVPLVALVVVIPVLSNLVLLAWLARGFRECRGLGASWATARPILLAGLWFVPANLGTLAFNHFPVLAITAKLGPAAAASWLVAQRLLGLLTQLHGVLLGPLWPAYAEAHARGDHAWIRKTFRRSMTFTLILGLAFVPAWVAGGGILMRLWTGESSVVPGHAFLAWQGLFGLTGIAATALSALLNGLGRLRVQAACATVGSAACLATLSGFAGDLGLDGSMAAVALAYGLGITLPIAWNAALALKADDPAQRAAS